MKRSCIVLVLTVLSAVAQTERKTTAGPAPGGAAQITFVTHRLGTDHAEGITTLDMNGDGRPDILSGAYWYESPGPQGGEWKRHQYRTVGIHEEFVSDCGEWTIDVNHDGAPDIVTAGWISNGVWWYENPRKTDVMWQKHLIADSYDTEGGWMADINGDGKPDLALAHYKHQGILWIDFSGAQPKVHHTGGSEQDGHGIGIADIDGDGKPDILTPTGWLKNIDADKDQWEWHAEWMLGDTGFPIIAYDVNSDGKMDIIFGQGHSYGLYWLEQQGNAGSPASAAVAVAGVKNSANRSWRKHTIDESFSQAHALALADIDGDGQPELLTGKRYRGHNGHDPGSYDPLVVYCYKINRQTAEFTRNTISVNGTAGVGTQIIVGDLDGDGDIDLAMAGKTGVHFFENLKVNNVSAEVREKEILIEKNWPFEGEGPNVQQEDGPPKR